jgi:GNAT superfamily N-acetyltransferase
VTAVTSDRYAKAGPEHSAALIAFFAREQVPCQCRYWHFSGDKNAWLERCYVFPEKNAAELDAALHDASEPLEGVVALDGERVIGWMKLTRAAHVAKLYDQRLYRGLPIFSGDRQGVFTVGCFLIDSEQRRRGIATRLLALGVELARAAGATAIEAFPRRGEGLAAEEQWTGPFTLFERQGFRTVHEFQPYPVLRLTL